MKRPFPLQVQNEKKSSRKAKNIIRKDQHMLLDLDKRRADSPCWIIPQTADSPYDLSTMDAPQGDFPPEAVEGFDLEGMEPDTPIKQ